MLESFPVALMIGTLLGFLSGLGIGGGSLLVLWMTVVLQIDPQIARSINLLFFIPTAIISCLIRLKRHELNLREPLPAMIAGCISAAVFSGISTIINVKLLKKLFGILLIAAGLREVFYRDRKAR